MRGMNSKLIHIFKPGRHVTMAGDVIEFSEADIAATARAYDPKRHEAPLVIGHPKTDDPAQGWVQALSASGRGLFAAPRDVEAAFAEQVGQRRYGKVSSKFYSPDSPSNPVPGVWYLRHVGFLGAHPPGVKGLDDPSFAEGKDDDGCVAFQEAIEFGDWGMETNASLWRRLREWMLTKFGQEAADQVIPDWQIETIREAARDDSAPQAAFADATSTPVSPTPQSHQETHAVTHEQAAQLAAENAQLKKQIADREASEKQAQADKRHADHAAFAEDLVDKGVLAAKQKDAVVAMLDLAATPGSDGTSVEFGEGEAKKPLVDVFKGLLSELPKVVEFGEVATKGRAAQSASDDAEFGESDPERLKQHQAIQAYMTEHKVDYASAARAVLK